MQHFKTLATLMLSLCFGLAVAQPTGIHDPTIKPTLSRDDILSRVANKSDLKSGVVSLDFEGLGDSDAINDFYNGGTSGGGFSGTNYGVEFSSNALSIIASSAGGSGNFSNNPSGNTIMFFLTGTPYLNYPAGFFGALSFYYASSVPLTINLYDGLNGSGALLASTTFPATPVPGGVFSVWEIASMPFSGIAKSVIFVGVENQSGFDDVTLGSATPGGSPAPLTPLPAWMFLLVFSLMLGYVVFRTVRSAA